MINGGEENSYGRLKQDHVGSPSLALKPTPEEEGEEDEPEVVRQRDAHLETEEEMATHDRVDDLFG